MARGGFRGRMQTQHRQQSNASATNQRIGCYNPSSIDDQDTQVLRDKTIVLLLVPASDTPEHHDRTTGGGGGKQAARLQPHGIHAICFKDDNDRYIVT